MSRHLLGEDLVRVRGDVPAAAHDARSDRVIRTLYWGDKIDFVDESENDDPGVRDVRIRIYNYAAGEVEEAYVRKRRENGCNRPLRLRPVGAPGLLEVTFVDVQHGDATFIRTPGGRRVLIDGGEEAFIARLLASVSPGTTAQSPLLLDALVVSHGDAHHFAGLSALAEARDHSEPRKRLHVRVPRVYHNGLVKRPEKLSDRRLREPERFGACVRRAGEQFVTEIYDDPRLAPSMNAEFARWKEALGVLLTENGAVLRRLRAGDHDAFDFLAREGFEVLVLGPLEETVDAKPALRILRDDRGGQSASHTINGHAVVLKLRYGNVRMLLGGPRDAEGSRRLLAWVDQHHPPVSLQSEIFKVPHHGSQEYLPAFLQAVAPVVSVVSSGDEGPGRERAHPRANLLAALGRYSRGDTPLLFSTGLAAAFAYRSLARPEPRAPRGARATSTAGTRAFHAFERVHFGVIRVRTDGQRVLVAPETASDPLKDAYAFRVDAKGNVLPDVCANV
jgi:ribonuclease BN (tRNA processing enzyme)